MSYLLPHLHTGWAVDQAILSEEARVVVLRFGHDWDPTCMQMDEILAGTADQIKNYAVIYLVDITEVFLIFNFKNFELKEFRYQILILCMNCMIRVQ